MKNYRVDLACAHHGGRVLAANDEFFAGKENLVADAEAIFIPDKYVATGKWMDGWETRRRRQPGHDWAVIELGMRGTLDEVVVDTAFFRGNFPEACSLEACDVPDGATTAELVGDHVRWREVLGRSELAGDSKNTFTIADDAPATHVRLRIYPDGGVARLRVCGTAVPDWNRLDFAGGLVDLVAVEHGGRVVDTSDDFFGHAINLIGPGSPIDMRDGWETRRRRGPGHDWIVLGLGAEGSVHEVLIDTSHFKGNAPGSCSIEVADTADGPWRPLLDDTALEPHRVHRFTARTDAGPARFARLNIVPDGGVARLRLFGTSARANRLAAGLARCNTLPADEVLAALATCCASQAWARAMAAARPFTNVTSLMSAADRLWRSLGPDDWRQAFAAHPRIGDRADGSDTHSRWSRDEQAGAGAASAEVLERLAARNADYEARFDHVFLVCATGKSAEEMLAILEARIGNDAESERTIAAEEQRKITRLRLEKWLDS